MISNASSAAREGMIIECPLNDLFHDVVTVILKNDIKVQYLYDKDVDAKLCTSFFHV